MTRTRNGFTLIELMLVITIIGILAGVSVTVTRQVYHTARVAKTNATIQKLDSVLMDMYADFENRRVPSPNFGSSDAAATVTQAARLWFLRDMIRMEMPNNKSEITAGPIDFTFQFEYLNTNGMLAVDTTVQPWHVPDSPLRKLYLKEINKSNGKFEPAKCLYLVVMYGNPEVRGLFDDNEIATDDDGLSYFVDGWGNPIYFLRWAPGLRLSERQPNITDWSNDTEKAKVADARPDPLDPTEIGGVVASQSDGRCTIDLTQKWPDSDYKPVRGWMLLPVVMSSGGEVVDDNDFDTSFGMMLSPPGNHPVVDPFAHPLGSPNPANTNYAVIHNHSARR